MEKIDYKKIGFKFENETKFDIGKALANTGLRDGDLLIAYILSAAEIKAVNGLLAVIPPSVPHANELGTLVNVMRNNSETWVS